MQEFNLIRLLDASPFIETLSDEAYDALLDYLIDTGATLENINIDDIIVNGIYIIDEDEFNAGGGHDNFYLLCEDEGDYYIIN